MITCKLGGKSYSVDYISGRVLRDMQPALEAYGKIRGAIKDAEDGTLAPDETSIQREMDTLVQWFCTVFRGQFSPDDVYDLYPVDRIMHDLMLLIMAVSTAQTETLEGFPTIAAAQATNR